MRKVSLFTFYALRFTVCRPPEFPKSQFLLLNELQLRYTAHMPRRMRAYAALAEEHYRLPVYPVLVNILPTTSKQGILDRYDSEFMGLRARQDYRVLNLPV